MSILIIDDSLPFKKVLKALLLEAGYQEIYLMDSVADAETFLQETENRERCDIVLMDIQMPDIDGIEGVNRFKENEVLKHIPIIMVSAQDEEAHIEKAFDAGAIDFINKPVKKIELRARVRSILQLKAEMDQRRAKEQELKEINKKLHELSITDGLTQMYNRRFFNTFFLKEYKNSCRQKSPLSVLMCDIDYFKGFNDYYGHLMGDEVLKKVAKAIISQIKRPADISARYGGEEFIVLLPDTNSEGAVEMGKRILKAVTDLKIEHSASLVSDYLSVSIGTATWIPQTPEKGERLIKAADEALYNAKERGRNCLVIGEVKE